MSAPYLIKTAQIPERLVAWEGKSYRWIGGTNYLAIGSHPLFQAKLQEGITLFSQNWGSSRRNNVQFDVWNALEEMLAKRFHVEAAALTSSGMVAGQIALEYAQQKHQENALDIAPFTHPALWRYPHVPAEGTFASWTEHKKASIMCMDGVGAPWVQAFDTHFASELNAEQRLLVDESHRLGIMDITIQTEAKLIQTASLSKAFGIPAGIILGSKSMIEELKASPMWVGASPPNPSFSYACLHAQAAYDEREEHMEKLKRTFEDYLKGHSPHIQRIENYPAFCSNDTALFTHLKTHGFLANQFAYPNVHAPAICKAILPASLDIEDVEELAAAIISFQPSLSDSSK